MQVNILGCGYLGFRAAQRWHARGDRVTPLTRSLERAKQLADASLNPFVGDLMDSDCLAQLPPADLVLYAVSYDRSAPYDRHALIVSGLERALGILVQKTSRLLFISTSSVHGESDGQWVDESTPLHPATEAGQMAAQAEELVKQSPLDTIILRLTGLYGPGRLLRRVEQFEKGEPIAGPPEAWLNLIHVEDAARAVESAGDRLLAQTRVPRIHSSTTFLISDDKPVRRSDYYEMLATAAGAPAPIFAPHEPGSRITGLGKRCRNLKAKQELSLEWQYPEVTTDLLRQMIARDS